MKTTTTTRIQTSRRQAIVMACAVAGAAWLPLAARADAVADMAAFDAAYIPALALSSAAVQDRQKGAQAIAALESLRSRWPRLRVPVAAALRGQEAALRSVDKHIDQAAAELARSQWKEAHESLEEVRLDLMRARLAVGIDYFVDRLTAYHEPMEEIVLMADAVAPAQFDAARRAKMEAAFAHASALWRQAEAAAPSPRDYGLDEARARQLREGMAAESRALSELSQALRGSDVPALLKAAKAIKPPFARAFTAFGQGQ